MCIRDSLQRQATGQRIQAWIEPVMRRWEYQLKLTLLGLLFGDEAIVQPLAGVEAAEKAVLAIQALASAQFIRR